jgi:predicted RecB family nuclease
MPGGVLIGPAFQGVEARAEATRRAMESGAAAVYEATFCAGNLAVSADILLRQPTGWALIEVKSASGVKPEHVADASYQAWVARAAGVEIVEVEVMHLNPECRFPALETLFVRDDVTGAADSQAAAFEREADAILTMLDGTSPEREIGKHCIDPEACAFKSRCWPAFPPHHVSTVYYGRTAWFEWVRDGYHTIHDFPDTFKVPRGGKPAARQLRSVREGRMIVEDGLRAALGAFRSPLAFLDFETVQPAIPVWSGCRPWEQVPVQFSCHVEDGAGGHQHHEWLADGPDDARAELAERLLEACDSAATVVAYNMGFEKGCIQQLAELLPERRNALLSLSARLVDLLPVIRDHIYHEGFGGSFSLKKVLGPLLGRSGYADLDIAEGSTASLELSRLLFHADSMDPQERAIVRQQLLDYCRTDTGEMIHLLAAVRRLSD